jgi:hypothetical protein
MKYGKKHGDLKLARWLQYCLSTGWSKDDLDALERIWRTFRNENGALRPSYALSSSPPTTEKT